MSDSPAAPSCWADSADVPPDVTLGALICLADLTQIFMLNMTYDVPVKLFSFHLILMSLLILAPDVKRLANFFFLHRPAEPTQRTPIFASRRAQRIAAACAAFLWLWIVGNNVYGVWDSWLQYGGAPPNPRSTASGPSKKCRWTENPISS